MDFQKCIDDCTQCHRACLETLTQMCLIEGGRHAEASHAVLMLDCAQICQAAADFMLRGSPQHTLTCRVCAELCRRCAESCEELGDMDRCAEICRDCAQSCQQMAQARV